MPSLHKKISVLIQGVDINNLATDGILYFIADKVGHTIQSMDDNNEIHMMGRKGAITLAK